MRGFQSLEEKIFLADGIKGGHVERIYGIPPDDFKIYLKLGRIDLSGVRKNFEMPGDRSRCAQEQALKK
jgi:hypothetical protein